MACFAVAPPYRRHGLARQLLARVVVDAPGRDLDAVEAYPPRADVPAGVTARLSLGKGVVLKGVSALVATFTRSSVWLVFSTQASGAACDDDTAAHAKPARTMRSAG